MGHLVWKIAYSDGVTLTDLLLMFLYLEVFAMVGQYLKSGQLPVRFPLYIAIVSIARDVILRSGSNTELHLLASAGAIVLIAVGVLLIRYGSAGSPRRVGWLICAPCRSIRQGWTCRTRSTPCSRLTTRCTTWWRPTQRTRSPRRRPFKAPSCRPWRWRRCVTRPGAWVPVSWPRWRRTRRCRNATSGTLIDCRNGSGCSGGSPAWTNDPWKSRGVAPRHGAHSRETACP
nr:phosphate-starvation-inducible PsiE family protein [Burkholderia gladioli]